MKALVLGSSGLIGSHMVDRLKKEGHWVRGVDIRYPELHKEQSDEFVLGDLRDIHFVKRIIVDKYQEPFYKSQNFDLIFQFSAEMGGAGYIFTGMHDADVMHNSSLINLNVLQSLSDVKFQGKIFWSSSACIYPQHIQEDVLNSGLKESNAYPANPDSDYGIEKLFSERLYLAYCRNYSIDVRIGRLHNVFGSNSPFDGERVKAPAAICRKVAEANDVIEIWGDGEQTRSFLHVDECIEGIIRLMRSEYRQPINIGSSELISINDLARMVMDIAGKQLEIKHIDGPTGVRGRNSDNDLIKEVLLWAPSQPLRVGITKLYHWVNKQVSNV